MPSTPQRVARALGITVAVLGVALAVVGAWIAIRVGPSGEAAFSASTPSSSGIVVPPRYLNAVDVPVRITATRGDGGPVWIGVATQSDADALLAEGAHSVLSVRFPAGDAQLRSTGSGALADVSTADVWRADTSASRRAELVVTQGNGPQTVVVASGDASPLKDVTTTVTWYHRTWFFEALAVAVIGAVIAAFALGRLWQSRTGATAQASGRGPDGPVNGSHGAVGRADRAGATRTDLPDDKQEVTS